ncbi:MAG: hypothetical protein U0414_43040 [Polyangiaceae bacterium]
MRLESLARGPRRLGRTLTALVAAVAFDHAALAYDADQASIDFADAKFDVACTYFVAAPRIEPSDDFQTVKHSIDQFACYVRAGLGEQADRARAALDAYYVGKPVPEEGKAPAHYRARFQQYEKALRDNGPRLTIELPSGVVGNVSVHREGAAQPLPGPFDAPRFVDAGTYAVDVASSEGAYAAVVTVANPFADGSLDRETPPVIARPIEVPSKEPEKPRPQEVPRLAPQPVPASAPPARAPGVVVRIAGGAATIAGAVMLGVAGAYAADIPESCDADGRTCPTDADTLAANEASAKGIPLVAGGAPLLAVGVLATIGGGVLYAALSGSRSAPAHAFVVGPWIDDERRGVVVRGSF